MTKTRIDLLLKLAVTTEWGLTPEEKRYLLLEIKEFLERTQGHRMKFTVTPTFNQESFDYSLLLEWSKMVE